MFTHRRQVVGLCQCECVLSGGTKLAPNLRTDPCTTYAGNEGVSMQAPAQTLSCTVSTSSVCRQTDPNKQLEVAKRKHQELRRRLAARRGDQLATQVTVISTFNEDRIKSVSCTVHKEHTISLQQLHVA
eukprot:355332-Chlamydomonas_euryale.AAC.2